MAASTELVPEIRFEIFTTCPQRIFEESLKKNFGYHTVETDIGLVQSSPLQEDLRATRLKLAQLLPFDNAVVACLANEIERLGCRLVICDIAPLGIVAARAAGITSVLVENFTWDWIYSGYLREEAGLQPHIAYLSDIFRQADYHIQTSPVCKPVRTAEKVNPISRKARSARSLVRARLGIAETDPMVLVTMGGVPDRFDFLSRLPDELGPFLVITGVNRRTVSHPKVIALPTHSGFYHPDLMAAADALVAKVGYSTLAEAFHTGLPYGYIERPRSPESRPLVDFIIRHLPSKSISPKAYADGSWIGMLPELLKLPAKRSQRKNGAEQVARYIHSILKT